MFISNNRASFHFWWKENMVKHLGDSKYYGNDCSNIPRNSPFCSFASFSNVSLTPFNNKPSSSRDLNIFISFIYSFKVISVVIPDPKFIFFNNCTAASVVNPNGTKILSAYSVSTFFINDNASLTGGPNKLKLPSSWLIIFLALPFKIIRLKT